jgi:hypothetical protein
MQWSDLCTDRVREADDDFDARKVGRVRCDPHLKPDLSHYHFQL